MTKKQIEQFNRMRLTLKLITQYESPDRIRKASQRQYGLDYEDALGYAYENIQAEAAQASRGVKEIKS